MRVRSAPTDQTERGTSRFMLTDLLQRSFDAASMGQAADVAEKLAASGLLVTFERTVQSNTISQKQ